MKSNFKRLQSAIMAFFMALSMIAPLGTYAVVAPNKTTADTMITAAATYLTDFSDHQFASWDVFALARAGRASNVLAEKYYNEIVDMTGTQMGKKTASDVANMVLSLGAYGYDTALVGTHKLHEIMLAKLGAMDFSTDTDYIKGYDTSAKIMSPYYVLDYLKLDTSSLEISKSQLAFYMAKHLSDTKNYAFNDQYPSIETEAMLMVALAPLNDKVLTLNGESIAVNDAIKTATEYYKSIQAPSGGFTATYGESVEANSWILHALQAVGAVDEFKVGDKTPFDGVTSFFDSATGGFKGYGGVNEFSTQQALYNLVGYEKSVKNSGHLYDISKVNATKPAPAHSGGITDNVEKPTGKYASITVENSAVRGETYDLNERETPISLLKRAMGSEKVELDNGYISGVKCGEVWYREFENGAHSGWKFMVNGEYVQQGGTVLKLQGGDRLEWRYLTGDKDPTYGGDTTPTNGKLSEDAVNIGVKSRLSSSSFVASDWDILSKTLAGGQISDAELAPIMSEIVAKNGDLRKITDTTKYAVILNNAGKNPANVEGIDLYSKIYNGKNMLKQGINGPIFALIAFNASGDVKVPTDALWSRGALRAEIITSQNVDGGWGLTRNSDSDVDITAMALTALAPYKNHYATEIDRALKYLSNEQQPNGGFIDSGLNNTESAAQVIIALGTLGIDIKTDKRFTKNGKNPLGALLTFALEDGTFTHGAGIEADPMSTVQGTLAVLSTSRVGMSVYQKNGYVYDDFAHTSTWAKKGVEICKQKGIMLGDGVDFMPQQYATAYQVETVIERIETALGRTFEMSKKKDDSPIDRGTLYTRMEEIGCDNLLFGGDSGMELDALVTREMLATVAVRILEKK